MSLLDDMRRTLTDAAGTALEKGQQAADTVRLQAQLKKLQLERARKMHDLGARTYDWFKSGTMIVTGPVPSDVVEVCRALQSVNTQMDETQKQIEEAAHQDPALPDSDATVTVAATSSASPSATTATSPSSSIPMPPNDPHGTTHLPYSGTGGLGDP